MEQESDYIFDDNSSLELIPGCSSGRNVPNIDEDSEIIDSNPL